MPGCIRVHPSRLTAVDERDASALSETDAGLAYACLRFDLLRLARQLTDKSLAEEIVQAVFRHAVLRGPETPRDARGLPRPAYLASLVHTFIAEANSATPPAPGVVVRPQPELSRSPQGARGG